MSLLGETLHLCVATTAAVIQVERPLQTEQRGGRDPTVSCMGAQCLVGSARPLPSMKAVTFERGAESFSSYEKMWWFVKSDACLFCPCKQEPHRWK